MRRLFRSTLTRTAALAAAATLAVGASPSPAAAQAELAVELAAGAGNWGRFLEQTAIDPVDGVGQRELTAATGAAFALNLWVQPWDKTAIRVGGTFAPSTLEFTDDSGDGDDALDREAADIEAWVVSLDVVKFMFDPDATLAPYASGGVTATRWGVDGEGVDGAGPIVGSDSGDDLWRFGGTGAVGVRWNASDQVAVNAEWTTHGLGNPFDGANAFRALGGATFDEPNTVRLSRLGIGVTIRVGE